jgi:hypothetical protein
MFVSKNSLASSLVLKAKKLNKLRKLRRRTILNSSPSLDKDKISGYYVNKDSKIVGCVPFPRAEKHSNIFHKESQAVGSLALARLSQQLADFNAKTDILCHSTFCLFCLVALSNHSSLVATLKLHTYLLENRR